MTVPLRVSRNLKHWTFHVLANSSVSFAFAYRTDWHTKQAVIGMIAGILGFIALYTALWNSRSFRRRLPATNLFSRAFLYATRLRSALCLLATPTIFITFNQPASMGGFALAFEYLTFPDILSGIWAAGLIAGVGRSAWVRSLRILMGGPDPHQRAQNMLVGDTNSLVPTFLITMAQGVFLSVILLVMSLCVLVILKFVAIWRSRVRSLPETPPL